MKTPIRISLLALVLAPLLGGCNLGGASSTRFSAIDSTPTGTLAGAALSAPIVAADDGYRRGLLSLPAEAGVAGRLTERSFANGLRQSLSLSARKTLGDWNDLTIDVQTASAGADKAGRIPMDKPTEAGIRHEILSRFPQTPMRIVGRPMRNAFGPFGLAVGAGADGSRCAYAWQWIDDIKTAKARGGESSLFNPAGAPASIRMRLCRQGVSADTLAAWFQQLDLTDGANVEQAVSAARESAHSMIVTPVGRRGARTDAVEAVQDSLESALPRSGRAAPARRPVVAAKPALGRHVVVEEAPEEKPRARRRAPPAAVATTQPYLAPPPAAPYAAAPVYAASAEALHRLDASLPAQAFRGPAGAASRDAAPAPLAAGYGGAQPRYLGQ